MSALLVTVVTRRKDRYDVVIVNAIRHAPEMAPLIACTLKPGDSIDRVELLQVIEEPGAFRIAKAPGPGVERHEGCSHSSTRLATLRAEHCEECGAQRIIGVPWPEDHR